jgi:hypothetical protein
MAFVVDNEVTRRLAAIEQLERAEAAARNQAIIRNELTRRQVSEKLDKRESQLTVTLIALACSVAVNVVMWSVIAG